MTYWCRRADQDGRLRAEVGFSATEMRLFRAGEEAYLLLICNEPEHVLDAAGAIRPYAYSCNRVSGVSHILVVEEIT